MLRTAALLISAMLAVYHNMLAPATVLTVTLRADCFARPAS
jgi:hypothetical protein